MPLSVVQTNHRLEAYHYPRLSVVAEGVETADQLTQPEQLGCEYVQGYFFSKPVNSQVAAALIALLSAQPK